MNMTEKNLEFIMLVGLPASGKTWWTEQYTRHRDNYIIASTDEFVDNYARMNGVSYQAAFEQVNRKDAESYMYGKLNHAIQTEKNIIWDQTNLNSKARMKKLARIPDNYKKIVRVFNTPESIRIDNSYTRFVNTNKFIPAEVINQMKFNMDYMTSNFFAEGFDEVHMQYAAENKEAV